MQSKQAIIFLRLITKNTKIQKFYTNRALNILYQKKFCTIPQHYKKSPLESFIFQRGFLFFIAQNFRAAPNY